MKTIFLVLALSAALSLSAYAQNNQDFIVTNGSGVTVVDVYASPSAKNMWGNNLITKSTVANGESFQINVPVDANNCTWDIKFHDNRGKEYLLQNVDLCKSNSLTLVKQEQNDKTDLKQEK